MLPLALAAYCLFAPPDRWDLTKPQTPSSHAVCGFVDTSKSGFCPSIHLTYERTACPIEKYLEIISATAKAKRQKWRRMSTVQTKSGEAYLVEMEMRHALGNVTLLQAILPWKKEMHILTAGVLKKDLPKYALSFQKAFQSMSLVEDLLSLSKAPEELRHCWQKKEEDLKSFQRAVYKEDALGPVYQIQLLRLQ